MQRIQKAILKNGVKFIVRTQVLLSCRFGWTVKRMDIGKPEKPKTADRNNQRHGKAVLNGVWDWDLV